jgi:peptidoglycan hydrolase-like protein with peptidoglycan-binding domain
MISLREAVAIAAIGMFTACPALAQQNGADTGGTQAGMQSPSEMSGSKMSHGMVRQMQQELKSQGLYEGHVDGRFGPQTRRAVEDFQRSHNLTANGQPDQQTLAALQGNQGAEGAGGAASGNAGSGPGASNSTMSGMEPGGNSHQAATGGQTGTPSTNQNMAGTGTGSAPTGSPTTGAGGTGNGAAGGAGTGH